MSLAALIAVGAMTAGACSLPGDGASADVVVVDGGSLETARRPLELRIREQGRTVVWLDASEACAFGRDALDPSSVSVVISSGDPCLGAVLDRVEPARLLVVDDGDGAGPVGVTTIDVRRLVGASGQSSVTDGCQWWEPCPPGAPVEVRDRSGRLTEAGAERVARAVVARL